MNEIEKIENFRADIAIIETIEEAKLLQDSAEALAKMMQAQKVATKTQNELGRVIIELEQKKGALLDREYPQGGDHGNQFAKVQQMDLATMPVTKNQSARARKVSRAPQELIEEVMIEIEEAEEVITPNKVAKAIKEVEVIAAEIVTDVSMSDDEILIKAKEVRKERKKEVVKPSVIDITPKPKPKDRDLIFLEQIYNDIKIIESAKMIHEYFITKIKNYENNN